VTFADYCPAAGVDWDGNARPIFYGKPIFALRGDQRAERRIDGGSMSESRRVDITPAVCHARH
jgi:hypothetical protein